MKDKLLQLIRNYWPLVGYFLISVIFLYPILIQEGIPFKYDWMWPLFDMNEYWRVVFDKNSFGLTSSLGKYANVFLSLFGLVKISPNLALKIFLFLAHTISGYAFYLLVSKRIESRVVAFIAGVAYAFSPYIFIRTVVGFVYSLIAYACLPLFMHLFLNHEKKKIVDFIWLGLLFSFIASQIQAVLLLTLLLFIIIFSQRSKIIYRVKELLLLLVSVIVVVLPWVIYLLFIGGDVQTIDGGQVTTLNYIANLPHSLRNVLFLSDHIITRDYFYSFAREPIVVVGFVVFYLVSLFSLFDKKNRPLIFSLIISSLLILPFSIGPTGFFTGFYIFVFNHFPLIAVFRETYHFQFLLSFNIIALFAFGLSYIFKNLSNKRPFFWLIKVIAASSIVIVIAPYLGFDYAGYFRLQEIPDEYRQADQFFQTNADYCKKAYYPPSMGFVRFSSDPTAETSASNSDIIAWDFGLPRVTDAASVLSIAGDEMYQRNHLTSQFLEFSDNGEFAALAKEQGVDCVIVRDDLTSLYFLANNVWRDPSFDVRLKWMNQDMLSLAESKKGLRLDKQFGDKIFLYKIETDKEFNTVGTIEKLPEGIKLPITDWANNFDWYTEGWARGRYNFWRKHLFAQLEQDFIYTNRPDSEVGGNIAESGSYDLIIRYLDGGDSGEFALRIQNKENRIKKTTGEERFVVKNLGVIDVKKGDTITIKNTSGENAIADLFLVRSKE
ncbi:MAG TPA: hypothetical protein PLE96_02435 [bacterium]|nr:hypothetical protein [bacterium]